ncbi:hypothetical protein PN462_11725, partial [Spirulina sp. CS-785/01]|nr:hypothetical protein [Spirulina sp. CS-785/01]
GVGKTELFRYNTALREEFGFVKDLNSHACQTAVERTLRAITRFYENCKQQKKGRKTIQDLKSTHALSSIKFPVGNWMKAPRNTLPSPIKKG